MSIREQIKEQYEILHCIKKNLLELGFPTKGLEWKKAEGVVGKYRDRIKELQARITDPIAKPITADWRSGYDSELGESGYDYVIIPDCDDTDDELSDWFDCCIAYPPIFSPYDCTGKRFTSGKHIRRTPAGVVVIHRWSLDI